MSERFRYEPITEPTVPPPVLEPSIVANTPAEFAFSRKVRREILHRDGCKCVACGVTTNLEASHFNHDKSTVVYDSVANGETLCSVDHLIYHQKSEGSNGLTVQANRWAIKEIFKRALRQVEPKPTLND